MPDVPEPPTSATHINYARLVKLAQADPIIAVAVAHPCDEVSLQMPMTVNTP
jgi:phosphate acetyltransferase